MKKIATLLLAAGLLFSAAGMAQAIDFKIRGQWIMAFDYGEHGAFTGGNGMTGYKKGNEDNFEARQRLRLQLDAVASENLSGSVIFEMGDQIWGQSSTGGALGADGTVVEVKNAWLDWMVPDTDIKVRMGLQGFFLPSMTTGSQVWGDDAAGITDFIFSYGVKGENVEQARKILTALQWGPFIKSDNSQLIPLRQLELFRAKTVLEGNKDMDAKEKAAKIAEIERKLAELGK